MAKKYELVKCNEIMEEVVARQSGGKRRKMSLPNAHAEKAPSAPISPFGSSVDDMAVDDVIGRIKKEHSDESMEAVAPEYKKPARYVSTSNISPFNIDIPKEQSFGENDPVTEPQIQNSLSKFSSNASNITAGICRA